MSYPATPEEILAYAEDAAADAYRCHIENNVDLNPYSTVGARGEWQRGYDGRELLNYQGNPELNLAYQHGKACARLVKAALNSDHLQKEI